MYSRPSRVLEARRAFGRGITLETFSVILVKPKRSPGRVHSRFLFYNNRKLIMGIKRKFTSTNYLLPHYRGSSFSTDFDLYRSVPGNRGECP